MMNAAPFSYTSHVKTAVWSCWNKTISVIKHVFFLSFIYYSRKNKVKRTIRVPAISSKIADIPPDEYSWRKYGQKPIKGSPHPGNYHSLLFLSTDDVWIHDLTVFICFDDAVVTISAVRLKSVRRGNTWNELWMIHRCLSWLMNGSTITTRPRCNRMFLLRELMILCLIRLDFDLYCFWFVE